MGRYVDMVGKRFGRLIVLSLHSRNNRRENVWLCQCDCGNKTTTITSHLNSGNTKSCGCLSRDTTTANNFKHGYSVRGQRKGICNSYYGMVQRCTNKKHPRYADYGGRGIVVCNRWLGNAGFVNFIADMGDRPPNTSIERRNNNGNYEPSNCYWATKHEQARNTRTVRLVTYNEKQLSVTEVSKLTGINRKTLYRRLNNGMDAKDVVYG